MTADEPLCHHFSKNTSHRFRIVPRVFLPVGKQMRTKSVPGGKITRGGTREWVGWDASHSQGTENHLELIY